ncbi:unnamed protein product [Jaminaea pallidilutea]
MEALPPTRLPRFDVFRPSTSAAAAAAASSSQAGPRQLTSALSDAFFVEIFARWLLRLINSDEACFVCSDGEQRITQLVVVERDASTTDQQKITITQRPLDSTQSLPPTDFALALGAAPHSSAATNAVCQVTYDASSGSIALSRQSIDGISNEAAAEALLEALIWEADHQEQVSVAALNHPLPADALHNANESLLHRPFEEQACRTPDHPALNFIPALDKPHVVLSYAELNARADCLALHLSDHAAGAGRRPDWPLSVPLFLGPSVALYISQLACLKAGLAFSPLPVDAPTERLAAIISDQQAPFAVYSSAHGRHPDIDEVAWIDVAALEPQQTQPLQGLFASSSHDSQLAGPQPSSLAYLLYTSGSTGLPKGVQITHSSAATSIQAHSQQAPFDDPASTRWFQFAAPTFDPSVMEIFVTLGNGATLCSAERSLTLNDLNRTVAASKATIMMATPSLASLLRREELPELKCLWTMGEALSTTVIDRFVHEEERTASLSGLWNAYGPTEAAINCTLLCMRPSYRGTILGPPLRSCSLFVVDLNTLSTLPFGVSGELIIGGPQVSQLGYLKRPKESQGSFVDVPHLGGRVYRTGDAARTVWSPQGGPWIEILGRIGHGERQVKVHGQRLELSEVESCLYRGTTTEMDVVSISVLQIANGSLAALVQVRCDLSNGKELEQRWSQTLRQAAEKHLAPFARPQSYLFTSRMFSSMSGKLDKKALRAYVEESVAAQRRGQDSTNAHVDPALLPHIDVFVKALQTVTGASDLTSSTSMDAAGLDSLGAMRLLDTLRSDELLAKLTLRDLVGTNVSVALLVQRLQSSDDVAASKHKAVQDRMSAFADAHRAACSDLMRQQYGDSSADLENQVLPVTATQSGILTSFTASRSYVHHFCYSLLPDVDIDRFCAAAESVFSQCEAMRSVFLAVDDDLSPFAQCVLARQLVQHPVERTTGPVEDKLQAAEKGLSLERPPFRHQLITADDGSPIYAISLFHGIFDGGSLAVLLQKVQDLYRTGAVDLESIPGPKFAAEACVVATTGDELEQTKRHWKDELSGFEVESFSSVHGLKKGLPETSGAGVVELHPPQLSIERLQAAAKALVESGGSRNPSPLALVQLAWCLVLSAYSETSKTDIVFGSVVSNRLDEAARACVSPTFTTLPVRLDVADTQSIVGSLQSLSKKAFEALPYSQPALGSIVSEGGKLPYDTLVALQLFEGGQDNALWSKESSPAMPNDFAVMLEVWPGANDGLRLRATYQRSVLNDTSCRMLLEQFSAILDAICQLDVQKAEATTLAGLMSTLEDTSPGLCAQVGEQQVSNERYEDLLLHRQFEQHAMKRPEDVALCSYDAANDRMIELTYQRLDQLSSALAQRILETASGTSCVDRIIPLYANKSVEMYIAVLGILKAGAAWCPIEPTLPRARKAGLIRRAGSDIVVVATAACAHDAGESATPKEAASELQELLQEAGVQPDHAVDASALWRDEGSTSENGSGTLISPDLPSPSSLAYCIWTSGTTGEPKGVLIEHQAGARAMRALQQSIPVPHDVAFPRTISFSAFTFDVFVQDLFYTWGLGGMLITAPRQTILDVDRFADLCARTSATHAHLTPAFGACLPRSRCPSLRTITMIGEKLGEEVASQWQGDDKGEPSSSAWNTYGPAENAVVSTYRSFQRGHIHPSANVGWPLDGVTCLVMRSDVQKGWSSTIRGGTGELALGGGQVARGYLGDEARTAERYPTLTRHGRIYLTGDIVRMLADGSLDFVGRRDDLIKVSGIRIELSEISHTLIHAHDAVRHIETLYLAGASGGTKSIVAFLLASNESQEVAHAVVTAVRARAESHLPIYMQPTAYIVVDHIPRSTSAKTDTRALTAMYHKYIEEHGAAAEDEGLDELDLPPVPADSPQARLAQLLADTIGGSQSKDSWQKIARSSRTSLRSIGVDSIRMIRLATRVRQSGLSATAAAFELMKCETFGQLCDVVLAGDDHGGEAAAAKEGLLARLTTFDAEWRQQLQRSQYHEQMAEVLPTTAMQAAMLAETAKQSSAYWSTTLFELPDGTTDEAVKAAWMKVLHEVEMLRTTFVATAQGFVQSVLLADGLESRLDFVSVTSTDAVDGRRHSEPRVRPEEPLYWGLTAVRVPGAKPRLAIHMHHALYDAEGFEHLISRVAAHLTGRDVPADSAPSVRSTLASLGTSAIAWPQSRTGGTTHWTPLLQQAAERCSPWSMPKLNRSGSEEPRIFTVEQTITAESKTVAAVARQMGLPSAAAIVQAAFGCLLADYLDQGAVLIGSTLSERGRDADLVNAVFPLVTTVPFLIDGGKQTETERRQADDGDEDGTQQRSTVAQLLSGLAKQWKDLDQERYVSAAELRNALGWPRDQALYPALFVVHARQEADSAASPGLREIEDEASLSVEHGMALNVYLDAAGNPDRLVFSAASHILSERHADIFVRQLDEQIAALIGAATQAPDTLLSDLEPHRLPPLASGRPSDSASMPELLSIQSPKFTDLNTEVGLQRHPCHWLRHYASTDPKRIAASQLVGDFTDNESKTPQLLSWSYEELDQKSDQLAAFVRDRVARQSSRVVALCMDRTLVAFAAVLAIFKADCTYLPIAEDLPDQRKLDLVDDASAAIILVSQSTRSPFTEGNKADQVVDCDGFDFSSAPSQSLPLGSPRSCGYLLYTSGSTGKPKGVSVSGANLSAYLEGFAALLAQRSRRSVELSNSGDARYLNIASRAFDPHISQMFTPWRMGWAAVTGERNVLLEDLAHTVNTLRITHMGILPSLLEHSGLTPETAPSLVGLSVGGEKISQFILDAWAPVTASRDTVPLVLNAYGPTEVTIGCTMAIVTKASTPDNIGYPLGETTALIVLPGTQKLARRGQSGEIVFAGDLVAHGGYLGRPAHEQGGFDTLPDGADRSLRVYRSGDMARMLDDGTLSFLGRADEQIKIRGQRLELNEVNSTVKQIAAEVRGGTASAQKAVTVYVSHPSLASARIFTVLSLSGDRATSPDVPFVDCEQNEQASHLADTISHLCKEKMPSFMVPTLVLVEALPQLPSGKFDIKKTKAAIQGAPVTLLLRDSARRGAAAGGQERPLTAFERTIVEVVSELTGADAQQASSWARPSTSLFELGLDSLSAVGLTVKLREHQHVTATVSDVLQNDTLEALAAFAERQDDTADEVDMRAFYEPLEYDATMRQQLGNPSGVEWFRPAMPLQQSLLNLTALAVQESPSSLSLPYLHRFSIECTSQDAAAVRAKWSSAIEREPVLRTCFKESKSGSNLVQAVLSAGEPNLKAILLDGQAPLSTASIIEQAAEVPPLRVSVDAGTARSELWIHHALYDGHSLPLLLAGVFGSDVTHRSANNDQDNSILAHTARAQGPQAMRFWQRYLDGLPPASRSLSSSDRAGVGFEFRLQRIKFRIDEDLTSKLRAIARSSSTGTTVSIVLQACFALVVARKVQTPDVVLGNVVDGRGDTAGLGSAHSRLPCVATVAVRHCLTNLNSLLEAVRSSKASNNAVRKYQQTALKLVHKIIGRGDLFEALYSYEVQAAGEPISKDYTLLTGDEDDPTSGRLDYPLVLNVVDAAGQHMDCTLAYSETHVGRENADAMASQLRLLIELVANESDPPLSDLGIPRATVEPITDDVPEERPLSARETDVLAVLKGLLGSDSADEIGPYTSFYRAGLDSLSALKFARQLKQAVPGFENVTATKIMASGSLAKLCQTDAGEQPSTQADEGDQTLAALPSKVASHHLPAHLSELIHPLSHGDRLENVYQCTPLQSGMLTLSYGSPDSAYRQVHTVVLRPGTDEARLQRAWQRVVQHHDILRTTFHLDEHLSRWYGQVHSSVTDSWAVNPAHHEFDRAPPASVEIVDNQAGQRVARFHIHHALYDGACLPMIFEQLRQAYIDAASPPQASRFSEAAKAISASRDEATEQWSKELLGYQYAPLPEHTLGVAQHRRWRNSQLVEHISLASDCRALGVTLHAVCVLAFARNLSAGLLHRRDVCFGHVLDGRSDESDAQVIGPLFNTVARRVNLHDLLETNGQAARRVQENLNRGLPWQSSADLRGVISQWRKESPMVSSSTTRLFDCLFVYHKADSQHNRKANEALWDATDDHNDDGSEEDQEYEVNVSFVEHEGGRLQIAANATSQAVSDEAELRSFVETLAAGVTNILSQPSAPVLAYPRPLFDVALTAEDGDKGTDGAVEGDDEVSLDADENALCDAIETAVPKLFDQGWQRRPLLNVMEVGIDSITAIRLTSVCRKLGGVVGKISVPIIMRAQTVRGIVAQARHKVEPAARATQGVAMVDGEEVALLRQQCAAQLARGGSEIKQDDIEDVFPVLAGQEHHLDSWHATGRRFYEAPWVMRAIGSAVEVDEDKMLGAWRDLLERYAHLRSTFVASNHSDSPVQVVLSKHWLKAQPSAPGWSCVVCDSGEEVEEKARAAIKAGNERSSDLFSCPARLCLFKSSASSVIVLRLHHAMYDAWSISMILGDLQRLYRGDSISSPPIAFADVSRRVHKTKSREERRGWWQTYLGAAQATRLSDQSAATRPASAKGPVVLVRCPGIVTKLTELEATVSRRIQGANLSHVVIYALARLLSRRTTAKQHPTMGFYTAGRAGLADEDPEASAAVIPLLNVLPLAVDVNASVADANSARATATKASIQAVREDLLQRVSWEQSRLREVLADVYDGKPMFDVFLNLLWHRGGGDEDAIAGGRASDADAEAGVVSWEHWRTSESAEYFTSTKTYDTESSTMAGRDTSYLPEHKCYIDVRRDQAGDCLSFGLKADAGMFGGCSGGGGGSSGDGGLKTTEQELGKLSQELAEEISAVVAEVAA